MGNVRCSLGFHTIKVNDFPVFAGGVRDGIYDNAITFDMPPILQPEFQTLLENYNNKRYAYEQGGLAQRGPYREARTALMNALDELADYVNGVANGNANIITLAGYVPTKGNRSETPEPTEPSGVGLKRGSKGVLLAECDKQAYATSYGCILSANDPLPANIILNDIGQLVFLDDEEPENNTSVATTVINGLIDLNPGRKKVFTNLKSGTIYYVVFYAVNSTGVSSFSDPVSLMCG